MTSRSSGSQPPNSRNKQSAIVIQLLLQDCLNNNQHAVPLARAFKLINTALLARMNNKTAKCKYRGCFNQCVNFLMQRRENNLCDTTD